jgi:hypothetical protein
MSSLFLSSLKRAQQRGQQQRRIDVCKRFAGVCSLFHACIAPRLLRCNNLQD